MDTLIWLAFPQKRKTRDETPERQGNPCHFHQLVSVTRSRLSGISSTSLCDHGRRWFPPIRPVTNACRLLILNRNSYRVLCQQYATFFFPSCEGTGCGDQPQGLYTLPVRPSLDGGGREEIVVRTWTITSVYGNNGPLEITVQAKVRVRPRPWYVARVDFLLDTTWPVATALTKGLSPALSSPKCEASG